MARLNILNMAFIVLIKSLNAAIMQPHRKLYLRLEYLRLVTARGLMTTKFLFVLDFLFIHRAENLFFGLRLDKKDTRREKAAENVEKIISSEKMLWRHGLFLSIAT